MILVEGETPGPGIDLGFGPAVLSRPWEEASELLRVFVPRPTAAFSRRDALRPGFARAVEAARYFGFTPLIRPQGGQLAAYHSGSIVIDHVRLTSSGEIALRDRLQSNAELHVAALQSFGLDLRIGALPGEYCPGEFSVNLAGIVKVSGSAQRTTKNGWLLSTVVQVLGSESLRQVLSACHDALGYPFDPDTVGTLADLDPGIEADAVRSRLIGAYPITGRRAMSDVPPDVHSKAEELARLATPC